MIRRHYSDIPPAVSSATRPYPPAMESTLPHSAGEPSLINTRKLHTFVLLGMADFHELLGDMLREVPLQLDQIATTIRQGDVAECKLQAHSLRGILGYFGCVAMTARLNEIEKQDSIMPEIAEDIHTELLTLWENSLVAIREWEKSVPQFAM